MRLLLASLMLVAGCGGGTLAAGTYDGPLAEKGRQGAAHRVVGCDGPTTGGNNYPGEYDNGALSDDPETALRTAVHEYLITGVHEGYDLVREDGDRALFTFTHDGRVVQAAIVRDGEAFGDEGWYVESWARCDYAELPPSIASQDDVEVWSDARGRVSTRTVRSSPGPEHCDWQDMTFLSVRKVTYVSDVPREYARSFDASYARDARLPGNAVDTGFHRGDDHLWLSADGTRAYVGDRTSVDVWPRAKNTFGCM